MKLPRTESIETERLILRPFEMGDAQLMFDNWASDPEVNRFLTWPVHDSVDVTRHVIGLWMNGEGQNWCMALKENNEAIGSIAVVDVQDDVPEVGYCLSKKCWGKGYAPEALRAVIAWLFDHGAKRVIAKHDLENPNSGRVMEKAGMAFLENRMARNNLGTRAVAVRYIDRPIE